MSGRSDDAKEAKDIVYTGKEPFEKFDRQVNRWARRQIHALLSRSEIEDFVRERARLGED